MAGKKYGVIQLRISGGVLMDSDCVAEQKTTLQERPVVYIYYNETAFYVGQTKQFLVRHGQHLKETTVDYSQFQTVLVLYGQYVDGNSQLDLERFLLVCLSIENASRSVKKKRRRLNCTMGSSFIPDYSTKEEVRSAVLVPFWENELRKAELVCSTSLAAYRQSILFKYSPFTALSDEQLALIAEICADRRNYLIEGMAGTGKTVVLTNLIARLKGVDQSGQLRIGVVVKSNWKGALEKILRAYEIGSDVTIGSAYQLIRKRERYDVVIVDEAHRLRWGYSKQNHATTDIFDSDAPQKNELSLLGQIAGRMVLLYDSLQTIRPSDIPRGDFHRYVSRNAFEKRLLTKQFRVRVHDSNASYTADDYFAGVCSFLQLADRSFDKRLFQNDVPNAYFGIVDSISALFEYVDQQRQYHPKALCRVLAGYARPWGSKCKPDSSQYTPYDWVEDAQHRWKWNSTYIDWLLHSDLEDEIGCIHSVQGADLDYIGVIVAKDLAYQDGKVAAQPEHYYDRNGVPAKKDFTPEALTQYLKQIYYVLLTRGISGVRVYFEDAALKRYFMEGVGLA